MLLKTKIDRSDFMSIDQKFRSQKIDRLNFLQKQNSAENRQNRIMHKKQQKQKVGSKENSL
jgi:hypothetical protein